MKKIKKETGGYECFVCGGEVLEVHNFCPKCGNSFVESVPPEEVDAGTKESPYKCPKCLRAVTKEERICPHCNTILFIEEKGDVEERLKKISRYSLGQKLLLESEYLFEEIYKGQGLAAKVKYFLLMSFLFSALYGACLGAYSGTFQVLSSALKVPLLLFLTLLVCAPALYILNILLGSKLGFKQIIAILLSKTYLISIILAAFAPILLIFLISGGRHEFTVLLNVAIFGTAGIFGLYLISNSMKYLAHKTSLVAKPWILNVWIVLYIFVGTQLAWTLRPFIGDKATFSVFRDLEGNFYVYVFKLIKEIF